MEQKDGGKENPPIKDNSSKPSQRYIAQSCPVCNGFGTLKYGTKVCQACRGKGYVLVPNFSMDDAGGGIYGGEQFNIN